MLKRPFHFLALRKQLFFFIAILYGRCSEQYWRYNPDDQRWVRVELPTFSLITGNMVYLIPSLLAGFDHQSPLANSIFWIRPQDSQECP